MLQSINLKNYKCYEHHLIYFNNVTIAVGRNNAGKSTFIEAIRLISLVTSRYKNSAYQQPPDWTGLSLKTRVIKPSLSSIELDLEKVFYRHNAPPAIITATFSNNSQVQIYIGHDEEVYALIKNSDGTVVTSKAQARYSDIETINVLPQITPLQKDEMILNGVTIKHNLSSRRMSANFRNQLYLYKDTDEYRNFKYVVERTWHGLRVYDLYAVGMQIFLQLQDNDFVEEISVMGHGVQMWLQTMWFLSRIQKDSIVVLDEPDVYMHPDLQRKLIRILKNSYKQTIIATHSIEMISEVQPKEILIIDRKKEASVFVDSIPELQVVLNGIGSVHNIALSRLERYKKYLYVEGDDIEMLKPIYNILFPESNLPIDIIPYASTGGWGSWDVKAKDASRLLEIENSYKIYFIYDRDYHTQEEIDERKNLAKSKNLNICIWRKKELENYLVVSSSIARYISNHVSGRLDKPSPEEIDLIVNSLCEEMKQTTLDSFIEENINKNRKIGYKAIKKKVEDWFYPIWETYDGRRCLVSGKSLISKLSDYCQKQYGISFGTIALASSLNISEIHEDLKEVLTAVEYNAKVNF